MTGVTFPASMSSVRALSSPFGFPNLAGMMADIVHDDPESTLGWCDDQEEFEFGLDVILDGLDRLRVKNLTVGRRHGPVQKT